MTAVLHVPRTGWAGRAGETMGYRALCSCGWGWDEELHATQTAAMIAAQAHAERPEPEIVALNGRLAIINRKCTAR